MVDYTKYKTVRNDPYWGDTSPEEENYYRIFNDPLIQRGLRTLSYSSGSNNGPTYEDLMQAIVSDLQRGQFADRASNNEESEFLRLATNDHMGFALPERTDNYWTDSGSEEYFRMRDRLEQVPPEERYGQIDAIRRRVYELMSSDMSGYPAPGDQQWPLPPIRKANGGGVREQNHLMEMLTKSMRGK